jgi:hypothetical protein
MSRRVASVSLVAAVFSVAAWFSTPALADPEPARGVLAGRVVDGEILLPVEGATMIVTESERSPLVIYGHTDERGRFSFTIPPGRYDLLAVYGDARWHHHNVYVRANERTLIPGVLAVAPEVVTIYEKAPPLQKPQPAEVESSTMKKVLPYTDEAIDENVWAVGWVLLDVDEKGAVAGFRFLHRPGHGLDAIAEKEIFALRFAPATDGFGRPAASQVLWKLEWPAFHYAREHQLFGPGGEGALRRANMAPGTGVNVEPSEDQLLKLRSQEVPGQPGTLPGHIHGHEPGGFVVPGTALPPCSGKGPLNLDMHEPVYRDCSPPDLTRLATEQVVRPPGAKGPAGGPEGAPATP